jgi:hypothetical protein
MKALASLHSLFLNEIARAKAIIISEGPVVSVDASCQNGKQQEEE